MPVVFQGNEKQCAQYLTDWRISNRGFSTGILTGENI